MYETVMSIEALFDFSQQVVLLLTVTGFILGFVLLYMENKETKPE